METRPKGTDDIVIDTLAREEELVRNAIEMVASTGAVSVTVAGLRFGDQLLHTAEELAREVGVEIEPLWTADESGLDIRVRRPADA
jgi:hypothetical protein